MEYPATMRPEDDRPASGWAERPEDKQYDVHHGEYLPPGSDDQSQGRGKTAKSVGAGVVGLGVLLAKFKGLLLLLLNFKWIFILSKVFLLGGSFFISIWFYALFYGWKVAVIFVLMILAHEMGHYVTIRNYGLPAKLPMFVPGLGAYTMGGVPASLEADAYIALAGPLTGLGVSAICYYFGLHLHDPVWTVAAYLGAFVNLFNMLPVMPFDGGRVAGALSPALWVIGFALFIAFALLAHIPLFFLLLFGLFALPSAIAGFRGHVDPRYATMTAGARVRVATWYVLTMVALVYLLTISHVAVPGYSGYSSGGYHGWW